ncbi:hypothetical protein PQG44_09445 [Aquirufa sp. LEPPI-3A]|uniref:hypothetical protein n=1 Tax=Aquirufa regiilacus TaxID=3024868 RepID=UPI0028DDEC3F|nr:hypothetical protein [Aquirufa sp. LEPPI-3A]MDT8887901.1 hypothetical protein [Aquirufa sp. LEPPI-3A]
MEVHHPHHPPKSLKDYTSEFIVIFVALTLGFLVENQREHYIEGLREKELAKSLLKDLAADSVEFREFQQIRIKERTSINEAIHIIETQGLKPTDATLYYHFIRGVFIWRHPEFRQANLDQIISSGSLRYFKNDTLAKAISDLKMQLKRIEYRQDREKEYFYANIQPWVVNHLNLAHVDAHRNGLSRTKMMALLEQNQSSAPGKPYFLDTQHQNLGTQTANMLRGSDWLMNVTETGYYNAYKAKSYQLRKLIKSNFPD